MPDQPWRAPEHLTKHMEREAHTLYEEGYRAGLRAADEWPAEGLQTIEDETCRFEILRAPDPVAELCRRFNTQRVSIRKLQDRGGDA